MQNGEAMMDWVLMNAENNWRLEMDRIYVYLEILYYRGEEVVKKSK